MGRERIDGGAWIVGYSPSNYDRVFTKRGSYVKDVRLEMRFSFRVLEYVYWWQARLGTDALMSETAPPDVAPAAKGWTFLTNHAHVLLAIAREPTARLRDVAAAVGITERAAQAIVADLEAAGYLRRERVGRRNEYTINTAGRFRHPAEADHHIGDLIQLFTGPG